MSSRKFKIYGAFDIETSNFRDFNDGGNGKHVAIPVLFTFNDLSDIDLEDYVYGKSDKISFFRYESDFILFLQSRVIGIDDDVVPVVCSYNLKFDLKPLLHDLRSMYEVSVVAQSSSSIYYLDLLDGDKVVCRFWDVFHLERNGLEAMGEIAGVAKLKGSWDHSLIRSPETPLTDDELAYASRDVQIIPAYLNHLLRSNEFISSEDFGNRVITSTSLVRIMARKVIGRMTYESAKGVNIKLRHAFELTCRQNAAKSFGSHATRKACFMGGLTFTSGNYAHRVFHNVFSLDEVSAHHQWINGMYVPVGFNEQESGLLQKHVDDVINTSMGFCLGNYHRPFNAAFHVMVQFRNLRLKEGSVFERCGIGCIPAAKFACSQKSQDTDTERVVSADNALRLLGYRNRAKNGRFAFSKLISASECHIWCTEPDYVTLQSNMLFKAKQEMKEIVANYRDGVPYSGVIGDSVPGDMAAMIRAGQVDSRFLQSYYIVTVKGMFNSIFGTQAQDVLRPDYAVSTNGDLFVDESTLISVENFEERQPKRHKVLYPYGMRIVGGSRMQLINAISLIDGAFDDSVRVLGGDTDSLYVDVDEGITGVDLVESLGVLHSSCDDARAFVGKRVLRTFPDAVCDLKGVGHFELESEEPYRAHMEAWNKAQGL